MLASAIITISHFLHAQRTQIAPFSFNGPHSFLLAWLPGFSPPNWLRWFFTFNTKGVPSNGQWMRKEKPAGVQLTNESTTGRKEPTVWPFSLNPFHFSNSPRVSTRFRLPTSVLLHAIQSLLPFYTPPPEAESRWVEMSDNWFTVIMFFY